MPNRITPVESSSRENDIPAKRALGEPRSGARCQILAKRGFLSFRNLTSDLALILYSAEFRLGVLLHLPSAAALSPSPNKGTNAFTEEALAMILAEFETLGVARKELVTYVVGGSGSESSETVVRRALWRRGLVLSASDLAGFQARSVWMDVETGRTIIRSKPLQEFPADTRDLLAS